MRHDREHGSPGRAPPARAARGKRGPEPAGPVGGRQQEDRGLREGDRGADALDGGDEDAHLHAGHHQGPQGAAGSAGGQWTSTSFFFFFLVGVDDVVFCAC